MTTNCNLLCSRLENERKSLIEKIEQLQSSKHQENEQRRGNPYDKWDDGGVDSLDLDRFLSHVKQMKDHLREVEHALKKCEKGTYGLCDACSKSIDSARLEALPQANLCLSCKNNQKRSVIFERH